MGHKGIVLMEAILAAVIISISLTLIMQSLVSSYRNVSLQKDYTQAMIGLNNHLSKVLFDAEDYSATNENEGSKFKYIGELSTQELGTIKANLSMEWPSGIKSRQVQVDTIAFKNKNEKTIN